MVESYLLNLMMGGDDSFVKEASKEKVWRSLIRKMGRSKYGIKRRQRRSLRKVSGQIKSWQNKEQNKINERFRTVALRYDVTPGNPIVALFSSSLHSHRHLLTRDTCEN